MKNADSVAILFGSSGGFGQALYPYVKKKYTSVLTVDCKVDENSSCHMSLDIRQKASIQAIRSFVEKKGRLDAIIFSTGLGSSEVFWKQDFSVVQKIIDVNLMKPVEILHALSSFLIQSKGSVVFVGSTSAFLPSQKWLAYSISKSSLDHFCRSLQKEWRGKVSVSMFHPGPMKTQMHKNLGMDLKKIRWHSFQDPDWMAQRLMRTLEKPSYYRVIPEWKQRFLVMSVSFSKFIWLPFLRSYNEKKEMSHHREFQRSR